MQQINSEFYSNCSIYISELKKNGKKDDGFEDEFYYTIPALSDST